MQRITHVKPKHSAKIGDYLVVEVLIPPDEFEVMDAVVVTIEKEGE